MSLDGRSRKTDVTVTVLFFATLKDRAKTDRLVLELGGTATVDDLKVRLAALAPDLAPALATVLVSVNHEFAFRTDPVHDGDEVALFPPVSGGARAQIPNPKYQPPNQQSSAPQERTAGSHPPLPTVFRITNEAIDLNELVASVTLPSTGAACVFTGIVRAQTERAGLPPETDYLEYEAYEPMAEAKMKQVADEIRREWPTVEGIAIVQRIGRLAPGTPTVLIACSAAHRDTGVFEAARYGIDRLKEIVPVWKKEVGPGGEAWVEGKYAPTTRDKT